LLLDVQQPDERADEMKKFGGFIPGYRPGKPTADYLNFVLSRITLPGSIYLGLVAVLPNLFLDMGNSGAVANLPFGGTAVLIMVSVGLDTVKQIESQLIIEITKGSSSESCSARAAGCRQRYSGRPAVGKAGRSAHLHRRPLPREHQPADRSRA